MRCGAWAVSGRSVCYHHGGRSPRGIGSPHFTSGRFSKSVPARLAASYQEALADPKRLELTSELALIISRNEELLSSLYGGASGGLWVRLRKLKREMEAARRAGRDDDVAAAFNEMLRVIEAGAADAERWAELMRNIDQQRKLAESERKRRVEDHQVATVEELMGLMGALLSVITRHVKDERTRRAIGVDLDALISGAVPSDEPERN